MFSLYLEDWITLCDTNKLPELLCQGYLLQVKVALTTLNFQEVEQGLQQCLTTAKEANLEQYQNIARNEMELFLQHKVQILQVSEKDSPLSIKQQEELLQDYIKNALESLEKDENR